MSAPPARLGPYRLLRPLGAGGMGQVFLAELDRDEGFRKRVALKVMLPALALEPAFREQFAREARLAAALNHPHLVQVLDYGRDGDQAYLAMELVDGVDLARLLAARRAAGTGASELPPGFVLAVGLGCLRALGYAHGQTPPVVHGDLGPGNILLGRQGEVKLADFGLARLAGLQPGAGAIQGKPAYLAPEVALGEEPAPAADVFGLGAVLFELVTGFPPWAPPGAPENAGPEACLARARRAVLPSVLAASPRTHPGLAAVLQRALAARPEERFPAAAEMLEALERLAAGLGLEAGPRTVGQLVAELAPAGQGAGLADGEAVRAAAGATRVAAPGRAVGARRTRPGRAWLAAGAGLLLSAAALLAWLGLRPTPTRAPPFPPPVLSSPAPATGAFSLPARTMGFLGVLHLQRPLAGAHRAHSPAPSRKDSSRVEEEAEAGQEAGTEVPDPPHQPASGESERGDLGGLVVGCAGLRGWRLDGAARQAGPLEALRLTPGVRSLHLDAAGLEAQLRLEVPAAPGQPARLALRARPDAVVALDGRPRGMTPLGALELPPGAHRLTLSAPRRSPLELALEVP